MLTYVRRRTANLALILAGLTVYGHAQTAQVLHVELSLFSGRPRPKALIADSAVAQAIFDSLAVRIPLTVPCSQVPDIPASPLYTAALLRFSVPVVQQKTLVLSGGYIYYDTDLPCYRDPGSNLEKAAVAAAFRYQDLNAPGGPRPMDYLSCMVPDSLHAESQPCATGLRLFPRRESFPAAKGMLPAPRFGLDGRSRHPESPLFLLERPGRSGLPSR